MIKLKKEYLAFFLVLFLSGQVFALTEEINKTVTNGTQTGEFLCNFSYFKNTEFKDWYFPHIKNCTTTIFEGIGEKVWPGSGIVGFMVLLLFVVIIFFLYNRVRKRRYLLRQGGPEYGK